MGVYVFFCKKEQRGLNLYFLNLWVSMFIFPNIEYRVLIKPEYN